MKKFKLEKYKDFKQYFNLLDVLIKTKSSNKEMFLESINISPSSYRRVKKEGNKIGESILEQLSQYFEYNLCSIELVDEIEEKINRIYYDIYYKDYENYSSHYEWLDSMIEKRYIIFPMFKLLKLLMIINDQESPKNIQNNNFELYEEVKQYEDFFDDELKEIIEILDVTFKKDIDIYFLSNDYINELTYHTIATRCLVMKRYIESIYYCNKVKELYLKDENYKRAFYINLTLISNYNYLLKFKNAYFLAQKQFKVLSSLKNKGLEYEYTKGLYTITCLGLKKFNEVISILKSKNNLGLSEVFSLLISYYYTDKKQYDTFLKELTANDKNNNFKEYLNILNSILKNNNKKKIIQLETCNINKCILEILKKM